MTSDGGVPGSMDKYYGERDRDDRGRGRHEYYGGGGDRGGDRDRGHRDRRRRSRSRSRSRSPPSRRDGGALPYGSGAPSYNGAHGQMAPVGAASGMLSGMFPGIMNATAGLNLNLMAQDKVNRELFVGNTPPGTSEALLREFLNGAMRRVRLVEPTHTPIVTCRVNSKFAFIECTTVDDANKALNLNGIPFLGSCLKVSRPSKYMGPTVPAKTWQEITGQPLPSNVIPLNAQDDKINRELFIGNTLPEMSEQAITDFLGKAMEQVGLTVGPGNPIVACRLSGKFAFVELRTKEEAANALNLNNIPFLGTNLRVGRPAKYTGPQTPHGNWEDILAKYMSGELKLPSQGGQGAAAALEPTRATPAVSAPTDISGATRVVMLENMLADDDLEQDEEYQDIMEDTKEECGTFGVLLNIDIPRTGPGKGKIYLEYKTREDAANAIQKLGGRTFDGKKVEATYFNEDNFSKKIF